MRRENYPMIAERRANVKRHRSAGDHTSICGRPDINIKMTVFRAPEDDSVLPISVRLCYNPFIHPFLENGSFCRETNRKTGWLLRARIRILETRMRTKVGFL